MVTLVQRFINSVTYDQFLVVGVIILAIAILTRE